MFIKSVELWNIRSYEKAKIDFDKGITLLSGDIGSGKTTILKALEFALFGLSRHIDGASLLRHGKQKGKVRVELSVDGKDIIIERTLKRGKTISQDKCYLTINGREAELAPTEMKFKIMELLGYPKSIFSKTRDILYRYTVYTPQEEMKQIILEKAETRLEILRKLFGIEKYSIIKDNIVLLSREIKQKAALYEQEANKLEEYTSKIEELKKRIGEIKEEIVHYQQEEQEQNKRIKQLEHRLEELEKKISEMKKKQAEILHHKNEKERISKELEDIKSNITNTQQLLDGLVKEIENYKDMDEEIFIKEQKELVEKEKELEGNIKEIIKLIATFEEKIRNYKKTMEEISSLEKCPLCLQDVSHEHKDRISKTYEAHIREHKLELLDFKKRKDEYENEISKIRKRKEEINEKIKEIASLQEKRKRINDLAKMLDNYKKMKEQLEHRLKEIDNLLKDNVSIDVSISSLQDEQAKIKELLLSERNRHMAIIRKLSSLKSEMEFIQSTLGELLESKKRAETHKIKMEYYKTLYDWMRNFFIDLISNMEINVMASIHTIFNELFSQWFSTLVMSNEITARLDSDFSPIIEQQGYMTNIDALSGGERTAVALSYRLALNSVINNLIETIKTKNLVILDEPTEGFSSQQLQRVGEILRDLNMDQIIIVSHEQQLEGFCDNIIKIRKEEGVSRVEL